CRLDRGSSPCTCGAARTGRIADSPFDRHSLLRAYVPQRLADNATLKQLMAINVFKGFSVVDSDIILTKSWPSQSDFRVDDIASVLTKLPSRAEGDGWDLEILIGRSARVVMVPIERFLTDEEYRQSHVEPLP